MKNNWYVIAPRTWKKLEAMRNEEDHRELAEGTLLIIEELRYLSGCVKRGRGIDIDPEHPGRNVFEYIKELEAQINNNCRDGACGVCNNCKIDP